MLAKAKLVVVFLVLLNAFFSVGQVNAVYDKTDYNFWISLPSDTVLKIIHEIDKGRSFPAIVVAPQVPYGKSWEPKKIKKLLEYVQSQYVTDSNRVYVTGMSLGGYGTLQFAGAYPELVTAAVALCGGGNVNDAYNLSQVPIWIQHGNRDNAVPISESTKMVKAITECEGGEKLKYTIVEGAGHGDLEKAFRTEEIYEWMFQYNKAVEQTVQPSNK